MMMSSKSHGMVMSLLQMSNISHGMVHYMLMMSKKTICCLVMY